MQQAYDSYNALADILESKYLAEFTAQGLDPKQAKSKAEKKAIEDARFVLPNACETKMVVSMNARSLMNFFSLRCCNRAQWEIKAVADQMLKLCYSVAPTLFKDAGANCVHGACPEGKMSCGKCNEVRKYYQELKCNG
jgi:thymidylate synthase (FAD)